MDNATCQHSGIQLTGRKTDAQRVEELEQRNRLLIDALRRIVSEHEQYAPAEKIMYHIAKTAIAHQALRGTVEAKE